LAEAKAALAGDFRTKTFADVLKAAEKARLVTKDVTPESMIDVDFVNEAVK
jgi:NitT/TauT family transport system substrate-binding protein